MFVDAQKEVASNLKKRDCGAILPCKMSSPKDLQLDPDLENTLKEAQNLVQVSFKDNS